MSYAPTPSAAPSNTPGVMNVSDLNERLRGLFGGLGRIAVEGEVVGMKRAASGHIYFSLKDRRRGVESVIGAAIWRSQVDRALKQPLKNGDRVVAHGRLDLYSPRGSYSLIVERVEAIGLGVLLVQLEELKRELHAQGWFDRKRELPRLPKCIGVVTSRDTAAFQDFLRTRSLRWPLYPVRLAHTKVQGPGAAEEIARAMADLDASGVDLIVLTRGGGSLEDLWAFNERPVAEAIWKCSVPVVSGVGHETDVTLADYVADHRAHTPTDAGQMVIPARQELDAELDRVWNYLLQAMQEQLDGRAERLSRLGRSRVLRGADWILSSRFSDLASLGRRLQQAGKRSLEQREQSMRFAQRSLAAQAPALRLNRDQARLESLARRMMLPPKDAVQKLERRLEVAASRLEAFSPFAVLGRGYSITRVEGQFAPVTGKEALAPGTRLETLVANGSLISNLEEQRASQESPDNS